jgi:hypothetical protein
MTKQWLVIIVVIIAATATTPGATAYGVAVIQMALERGTWYRDRVFAMTSFVADSNLATLIIIIRWQWRGRNNDHNWDVNDDDIDDDNSTVATETAVEPDHDIRGNLACNLDGIVKNDDRPIV